MVRAKAVKFIRDASASHHDIAARTVLAIAGALTSFIGIVLVAGGLLSPFEGSAFWVFAGAGLLVSGSLIAKRNRAGAATYLAVFAATVTWSLHNIEHGSPLAVRLIGPAILLALLGALMPVLCGWRPRQVFAAFAVAIFLTTGLGLSSTPNGPLFRQTAELTGYLDSQAKGVLR